jgi:hypothetical protein
MMHIAAVMQGHRRGASHNKVARDRKDKIAAVCVFAEDWPMQCPSIPGAGLSILSPTRRNFAERFAIVFEADRVLDTAALTRVGAVLIMLIILPYLEFVTDFDSDLDDLTTFPVLVTDISKFNVQFTSVP